VIPGSVTVAYLHPGQYAACFAESLVDLLFFDAAHEKRITGHRWGKLAKECGSGGIVAGRNQVAKVLLDDTESEWLFLIDSDMGFAHDTVDRLVASADPVERPVMGGLAFACKTDGKASMYGTRYQAQPTVYDFVELPESVGFVARGRYVRDSVIAATGTGAACLLVHRAALEAVRGKYGDNWFTPVTHPKGPKGPTTFSEDLSFCVRLAGAGVPIHVNTAVKTTHDKGFAFLDEEFFDAQQARMVTPPAKQILVIVPTRGRPDWALRLSESHRATTDGLSDIVFMVDDDDPCAAEYVDRVPNVVVGNPAKLVEWTNRIAVANVDNYQVFGSVGDDHLFETIGWERLILSGFDAVGGTGVVYGDDGYQGENLPTACFVSTDIVAALGWMAPPQLEHMFCDNFWLALGRALGRVRYVPAVKITHLHPAAGKAEWDASYRETNSDAKMTADQQAWAAFVGSGGLREAVAVIESAKVVAA